MKINLSSGSTNLANIVPTVFGAMGKSGSFVFAEGSAGGQGKAKCDTCATAEIHFFVRWGVLFFFGRFRWSSGCRQVGLLVGVGIQRNCPPRYARLKSLIRMSKVAGLVVSLMVVVSPFRLACNEEGTKEVLKKWD